MLEVVAKAIYLLNFSLDCMCAWVQGGLFQGCRAVVKMTQLRFWSSSFHEHVSRSQALGFGQCGSGALFCMGRSPAPASVCFHTLILKLLWYASSWMQSELNQVHKTKRINRSFLSNLIWYFFTNSALTIRKSTKKQQSQVQTIQVTVITRNVTQDNGNINNFWKDSRLFFHQFLITFCYFLRPNQ